MTIGAHTSFPESSLQADLTYTPRFLSPFETTDQQNTHTSFPESGGIQCFPRLNNNRRWSISPGILSGNARQETQEKRTRNVIHHGLRGSEQRNALGGGLMVALAKLVRGQQSQEFN